MITSQLHAEFPKKHVLKQGWFILPDIPWYPDGKILKISILGQIYFFCVYNLHNLNYQSAYFFILHFLVNFPSQYAVVCAIACCCCVHCRDNESHFMFFKLILSPRSSNYCRQSILRPQRSVRLIRGICNFWKLYINWLHSFGTWPTTTSFPLLLT